MTKIKKEMSEHAKAAKEVRNLLKASNVSGTVKASSASMSTKLVITLTDCSPWTYDAVVKGTEKYQYGSFDGMTDMYNIDNSLDIPQVKYLFVNCTFSNDLKQKALDLIAKEYNLAPMLLSEAPVSLPIESQVNKHIVCYTEEMIRSVLCESPSNYFYYPKFWVKPVKRIMSVSN